MVPWEVNAIPNGNNSNICLGPGQKEREGYSKRSKGEMRNGIDIFKSQVRHVLECWKDGEEFILPTVT